MATFRTDASVGSTILSLEAQLPAVEERLRRAEAELSAASTERDAVRQALDALRLLSGAPTRADGDRTTPAAAAPPAPPEAVPDAEQAAPAPDAPTPAEPATAVAGPKKTTPARKAPVRKAAEPAKAARTRASARGAKAGDGTKAVAKQEPTTRTARTASRPRPAAAEPPTAAPTAAPAAAPTAARRTVTDADSILAVLSGSADPMRAREVSEQLGLEPLEANVNAVRTRLERLAKDGRAQRPGRGLYTAAVEGAASGA